MSQRKNDLLPKQRDELNVDPMKKTLTRTSTVRRQKMMLKKKIKRKKRKTR